MADNVDHHGNIMEVSYQQLKDHLWYMYADWFERIEATNLTYEVIYYFNNLHRAKYGKGVGLLTDNTYEHVLMLQEAMMEWDV